MDDTLTFVRKITRIVITVVVLGLVLNDGIRTGIAVTRASDGLKAVTNASLAAVAASPSDAAAGQAAAASAAQAEGVTLAAYNQVAQTSGASNRVRVTIEVSAPLSGTIVAAPLVGALTKVPKARWFLPGGVSIKLRSTKEVDAYGQ